MSFSALMNQTCTIQRNTPTQDNYGGTIAGWANVATGVPCVLQKQKASSQKQTDAISTFLDKNFIIYMPDGNDVQVHDRILLDSLYYDVISNNKDNRLHHFELSCELITD